MMFDESAGKLSLEQFIASLDSFFNLWRLDGAFRDHIMMYIVTRERIQRFLAGADLNPQVQETFRSILEQLETIGPIPGATTDDPAYEDHLLAAEKLWHQIRPPASDEPGNDSR
jgi:hypothetical protein